MQAIVAKHPSPDANYSHICILKKGNHALTLGVFHSENDAKTWGRNVAPVLEAHLETGADLQEILDEVVGVGFPDAYTQEQLAKP